MLMSRTGRPAMEALGELTGQGSQEWMNATVSSWRIEVVLLFLRLVLFPFAHLSPA